MNPNVVPATADNVAAAAARLRAGGLVAFPTETVYGLGADASDPVAVRRIYAAKGRPAGHPVIVHLLDARDLEHWAREIPEGARRLATAFWPGPLTLILRRHAKVDDAVTGGQDSVGLRVPAHPVARALLAAFVAAGGRGIAAPSANRFGHVSPTRAEHVAADLGSAVDMILDGGACALGIESTIVAFVADEPTLLRPGGIGLEALTQVLGRAPRRADADAPRASGTLAVHYAPRTIAHLVSAGTLMAEIEQRTEHDEVVAVLARSCPRPADFDGRWIAAPADAAGYARALYASLRELDTAGADTILVEAPPDEAPWLAVRDRLARATREAQTDET